MQTQTSRELLDDCKKLEHQNEQLRIYLLEAFTILDAGYIHNKAMRTGDVIARMMAAEKYTAYIGVVERFRLEAKKCLSAN